jgi:peptide/nickel transport system substrate-binding protein
MHPSINIDFYSSELMMRCERVWNDRLAISNTLYEEELKMTREKSLIKILFGTFLILLLLESPFWGNHIISAAPPVKELIYAAPGLPVSLDVDGRVTLHYPSLCVTGNLYDPLLDYKTKPDGEGNMVPVIERGMPVMEGKLAESWEISPDGLTITFRLRKGVKSNYGYELTAQDVADTFKRQYKNPGSLDIFIFKMAGITTEDHIKVIDRYTLQIKKDYFTTYERCQLGQGQANIADMTEFKKHYTKDDPVAVDWALKNWAGHGPYIIARWVAGQELVLEARPDYWRGESKIKRVTIKEVPESATRMALLARGAVDIAEGLTPRQIEELRGKPGIRIAEVWGIHYAQLSQNFKSPPFDNPKVRQAIAYAIPYEAVIKDVFYGKGRYTKSILPLVFGLERNSPYRYDLDKAKALLTEAGHAKGFQTTLSYNIEEPAAEEICVLIRDSLKKIGVDVVLDKMPPAKFAGLRIRRELPNMFVSTTSRVVSPSAELGMYVLSPGGVMNYAGMPPHPEVDKILKGVLPKTNDLKERTKLLNKVQDIIAWEYLTFTPICEYKYQLAMKDDIVGYTYRTDSVIRFDLLDRK